MELYELKKAWGIVSEKKDQIHKVNTDDIRLMLQRRSSGILSKLERNVKIGFWLLGIFILLTITDQYFPYERIFPNYLIKHFPTPLLIKIIGLIVNCTIMLTFILFVYRFQILKIRNLASENMRVALQKVIRLLDTFKKEFYLALILFSCAEGAGFITGVWLGIHAVPDGKTMNLFQLIMTIFIILLIITALVSLVFYLFHKGFNSLYGKYRQQLIVTMNELDETEE